MQQSEFARLRAQIEREHEACVWALSGLSSGNAQHAFINARFRRMDACHTQLALLVGETVATDVLCVKFLIANRTLFLETRKHKAARTRRWNRWFYATMTPSLCVIRLPTEDMLPLDFITTIHPLVKKRIPWGDFLQEGHLFSQ